jgi:acetyl-CoA carboxylase biotin carboxyl carrier protein
MQCVERSGFEEITLETDGIKLSLRRGSAMAATATALAAPVSPAPPSQVVAAVASDEPPAAPAPLDPGTHEITAPLLGTFYRSPKPGAPAFVEVGSVVEEETVIGILEVMKLMNTVRAGTRGTVSKILVTDGALAEYGHPLMHVRKVV